MRPGLRAGAVAAAADPSAPAADAKRTGGLRTALRIPSGRVFIGLLLALLACGQEEAAAPVLDADEAEKLLALGYLDYAEAPAPDARDGVVQLDAERAAPGLNLITYPGRRTVELVDREGRIVRSWKGRSGHKRWERAALLPGGDLLVVTRRPEGLLRLDPQGAVVWEVRLPVHHDVEVLSDGRLAVLTTRERSWEGEPVFDNGVALLSPDGELLAERSLLDVLATQPEALPLVSDDIPIKDGKPLDLFHANFIDWDEETGRVLVTVRHQDALVRFAWDTGELDWVYGRGELLRPHDAVVVEEGNVLIFDNRSGEGASRIVEVAPASGAIVWSYAAPEPEDFYSETRGTVQRLPGGTTLIGESNEGRAFEVTRDGEVVWEYLAPRNEAGHRPALRIERVPAGEPVSPTSPAPPPPPGP